MTKVIPSHTQTIGYEIWEIVPTSQELRDKTPIGFKQGKKFRSLFIPYNPNTFELKDQKGKKLPIEFVCDIGGNILSTDYKVVKLKINPMSGLKNRSLNVG